MEWIDLWDKLSTAGLVPALGIALVIIWRTWREERREHKRVITDLTTKVDDLSTKRHEESIKLIDRYHAEQGQIRQGQAEITRTLNLLLARGGPT